MESALVVIAILALAGGAVMLFARQGWLPLALPSFRPSGGVEPVADVGDETAIGPGRELRSLRAGEIANLTAAGAAAPMAVATREPIRLDLMPASGDAGSGRLDRIEGQLEELQRAVARQGEILAVEARRLHEELVRHAEIEEARREAAQERMRADVLAVMSRAVAERQSGANTRRMEVSAELYARLARFEAALATVTNPVLLPGEPYAPPDELAPEALVWENWNEVGERAFALAEVYSAQRLHLSAPTRSDVGAFVTTLRELLTRSIYPNLQVEADGGRLAALRSALTVIADELPKLRARLESEYLEGRTG